MGNAISSLLPDGADAAADRRAFRWVLLATLAVCGYLLVCSIGTLPILGDESQHFRRAQVYFQTDFPWARATHDPAYPTTGSSAISYYDACLWHMAVALLWRLLGHASVTVTQVYHTVYFFVFAVFTYLTAARLYGRRAGWWAWGLAVTMPMNLLFGMLFYLEIPALAFGAMAIYFLVRERPVGLGLTMAGLAMTKLPTAAVLAPPLAVVALLTMGPTVRQRLLRTLLAAVVGLVVMLPDMLWRYQAFDSPLILHDTTTSIEFSTSYRMASPKQTAIPFSLFDPLVDLKMFGVTGLPVVLVGLLLALGILGWVLCRTWREVRAGGLRQWPASLSDKRLVLAVPLLFYVVAFFIMLRGAYDVRYFQPTVLFAVILAGGLLSRWRPQAAVGRGRWIVRGAAILLLLAMAGQLRAVPAYVATQRRLSPEITEAYAWIREHTPEKARFLYIEANLVTFTGRPLVWAAAMPRYLFTVSERQQVKLLYNLGVQYLAIHPTRRCDTVSPDIEPTAYPRGWIAGLEKRPYLTRVYPQGDLPNLDGRFLIYRIDADKLPKPWIEGIDPRLSNPFWSESPAAGEP